ncbi:flagellar protein FlaG [Shewanella sp.]|uniref:flagellar protein FlaG n=1 Tax=Shewanella sp. TaxID=50422 RepID=UPI00404844F6
MSLIANPAAAAATAVQAQPAAPPALSSAQTRAVPAAAPVEKAPAVKVEPLVDPDQMRANLEAVIEKLNEQVERNGRGLNFAIDEKLNRPIITVRNTATGEVVRTIPNEVVIKVAHNIEDIKGLLMDHKL